MFPKPIQYYIYIAVAGGFAIIAAWIIGRTNNYGQDDQDNNSAVTDSSIIVKELSDLKNEITQNSEDPELNMKMANMLFDLRRYDEAIIYYRKILSKDPGIIAAQIDLSICYYNLDDINTALVEMEKVLHLNSEHLKGLYNIGVMYYNTGRIDSARYYWSRLLELHPESPEAGIARELIDKLTI